MSIVSSAASPASAAPRTGCTRTDSAPRRRRRRHRPRPPCNFKRVEWHYMSIITGVICVKKFTSLHTNRSIAVSLLLLISDSHCRCHRCCYARRARQHDCARPSAVRHRATTRLSLVVGVAACCAALTTRSQPVLRRKVTTKPPGTTPAWRCRTAPLPPCPS